MLNLFDLGAMSFEEGEKMLTSAGFVCEEEHKSPCYSPKADYILDTYFTQYDENGEELRRVSCVAFYNESDAEYNDGGLNDEFIEGHWEILKGADIYDFTVNEILEDVLNMSKEDVKRFIDNDLNGLEVYTTDDFLKAYPDEEDRPKATKTGTYKECDFVIVKYGCFI